jgi:hypothetical protein
MIKISASGFASPEGKLPISAPNKSAISLTLAAF